METTSSASSEKANNSSNLKQVNKFFSPKEQGEGDGAKVRRIIGGRDLQNMDPFLMLDLFNVKLPAGFPDHPHRGFETVTYMLNGQIAHEDFKGHSGYIGAGDVQWMTAGKGIMHAEMPASFDEPAYGFQLWINLDAKNKFCQPGYQEFLSNQIPVYKDEKMMAKVISGQVFNVKGPIVAKTPTYYIDFKMNKDTVYEHVIPKEWNSMIIVHSGSLKVQDNKQVLKKPNVAVFEINGQKDETIKFTILEDNTSFIMLAGKPLNEPSVQYGPFVLNNRDQLEKAFDDFQTASNGFEGANTWRSQIRDMKFKRSKSQ